MKRSILLAAALIGASGAGTTRGQASAHPPGGDGAASAALQVISASPTIRRVDSAPAVPGPDNACDPAGLCLKVTVSPDLDPGVCGDQTTINVTLGSQVNFCYTVTNNSDTPYEYQTASDNVGRAERQLFFAFKHRLEAHSTYQFNRIETMRETQRAVATWSALAAPPDYVLDDTEPFDFVDIVADGADLGIGEYSQTDVELPFEFEFYGLPSRYLAVGSGVVAFGSLRSGYISPWGYDLPVSCGDNYASICPFILPFGDSGFSGLYSGGVYAKTEGVAPNRRFIVEWYDFQIGAIVGNDYIVTEGAVTYEMMLSEGSNDVVFQYLDTRFDDPRYLDADGGATAVIGLNFGGVPASALAHPYSQHQPSLHDGMAIRATPAAVSSSRTTARSTVNVFAPALGINVDALEAVVPSHGRTELPVILSNGGAGNLRWNFGLPSSSAHLPDGPRQTASNASGSVQIPLAAMPQWIQARADENERQAASGSPLRYPLPARSAPAKASTVNPMEDEGIPAYVVVDNYNFGSDYIRRQTLGRWDLVAPETVTPVSDVFTSQMVDANGTGIDFRGDDFTTVYTMAGQDLMAINTRDGSAVAAMRFDELTGESHAVGFKYSPLDDMFYLQACRQNQFDCPLYKLDPDTGSIEQGPYLTGIVPVTYAIAATGEMYAVNLAAGGQLMAVDRLTGDSRLIGDMHIFNDTTTLAGWNMDFDDRTGRLYLQAYDTMTLETAALTVDTVTGATQELGRWPGIFGNLELTGLGGLAIATSAPFGPCTDLATTPWLTVEPASGVIDTGPYGSIETVVGFDAGTLEDGVYTANLCLNSNDPDRPHVVIPATLTVGDGGDDAVFRDGFD